MLGPVIKMGYDIKKDGREASAARRERRIITTN